MTLAEFKAWFEGFTETLEAAPNEKQWERIKARVAEINGTVTTYPVFVDRYVPRYPRWPDGVWYSSYGSPALGIGNMSLEVKSSVSLGSDQIGATYSEQPAFNAMAAMMDLGKAEYRALDS
ncbi:hypothetical protein [Rhizobium rhizogenes]|uniref:hypothetical protein n=1 Tax=Rhizobium rhizogenes TaxID=359 RepID=UPI00226EBA16|nr:hypothetical protein [Rhizobium rhizogenes]